ncbi:hypothetical protein C1646_763322 [Rhizophagus diaphanus]|nr:hypothetical protein C1646_763322 [Rhizophagus diaphanus] [Rhizophagus sp. MUCL 43196]
MKLSIPLTIVAIICIIVLEQIDAFNATFDGDPHATYHSQNINANPYKLHAKVMGSMRKQKLEDHLAQIPAGNVAKWSFDQQDMSYCQKHS